MSRKRETHYFHIGLPKDSDVLASILDEAERTGVTPATILKMRAADYYLNIKRGIMLYASQAQSSVEHIGESEDESEDEGKKTEEEMTERALTAMTWMDL